MNFREKIQNHIDLHFDTYKESVKHLYNNPEIGLKEYNSSTYLCSLLKQHGFHIEQGLVMPTDFRAIYSSGKPGYNIAFLCEYDALPEIGHGCGHNMIGVISIAAAAALKEVVDTMGGSIYVFGTPAEETHGGKVAMSNANLFDSMDVALMIHPDSTSTLSSATLSLNPVRFEFFGKSAHACEPENGNSALDAAVLCYTGINMLRQFAKRDTYIHGIFKDGGKAANIIPDYACLDYYFRSPSSTYTKTLEAKAEEIARGACITTGCTYKKSIYECPYDDSIINYTLCNVLKEEYEKLNVEDICPVNSIPSGSSDVGSVSYRCPTLQGYIKICEKDINGHSREFASATISEKGFKGLYQASLALANLAARLLCEDGLMKQVKDEFNKTK